MNTDTITAIAIDPGVKGAIAWITAGGDVQTRKLDSGYAVLSAVRDEIVPALPPAPLTTLPCAIEKVGGYIGKPQPASSAFRFGVNYGFLQGVLRAVGIPYRLVPPSRWQRAFRTVTLAKINKAQHKRELREIASSLFPSVKVTLVNADALLLLYYITKEV